MYVRSQDGKAITDKIDFNSYDSTIYNCYHEPFAVYSSMERVVSVMDALEEHINRGREYVFHFPKE